MISILQALGFMLLGATVSEWYNWRIRIAMSDSLRRRYGRRAENAGDERAR